MAASPELIAAKLRVLDRMVEAGWIKSSARSGDSVSIEPTEDGAMIMTAVQSLILREPTLDNLELLALGLLIKNWHD